MEDASAFRPARCLRQIHHKLIEWGSPEPQVSSMVKPIINLPFKGIFYNPFLSILIVVLRMVYYWIYIYYYWFYYFFLNGYIALFTFAFNMIFMVFITIFPSANSVKWKMYSKRPGSHLWVSLSHLPLWKMMDFVSWDDELPNTMESHKNPWFQTTNQMVI